MEPLLRLRGMIYDESFEFLSRKTSIGTYDRVSGDHVIDSMIFHLGPLQKWDDDRCLGDT